MKKFIIKRIKVLIIILVIFIMFMCSRIYHFVIANKVYNAIENFRVSDNRYYSVAMFNNGEVYCKDEIFVKDRVTKYLHLKKNINIYCEYIDFNIGEKFWYNEKSKILCENMLFIQNENDLTNIPSLIRSIYINNKINIRNILAIRYIIPIKHEDNNCYKIVTRNESIVIDKNTYLPIYSETKTMKSDESDIIKIKNVYEFKVDTVTDKDIELPDFSEYTVVN